jgi:DnaK suppressor protein
MLSQKTKEDLKQWLTQRLNQIMANSKDTFLDIGAFKDRLTDQLDQASLESDMGLTLRIKERESKLMIKIRETLGRLEDGTFGTCENCGKEISVKRLMARPVTTLCINCKREQETSEKSVAIN